MNRPAAADAGAGCGGPRTSVSRSRSWPGSRCSLAGPGHRFGWWSFGTGFTILRYAVYGGIAAAVVSAAGLVLRRSAAAGAACSGRSRGSPSGWSRSACRRAGCTPRARCRRSTTSRPTPPIRRPSRRSCRCARAPPNPADLWRRAGRRAAARGLSRHRRSGLPGRRPRRRSRRRSPRRASRAGRSSPSDQAEGPDRGERSHLLVRLHRRRRGPGARRPRRQPDRRALDLPGRRQRHGHERRARPRLPRTSSTTDRG